MISSIKTAQPGPAQPPNSWRSHGLGALSAGLMQPFRLLRVEKSTPSPVRRALATSRTGQKLYFSAIWIFREPLMVLSLMRPKVLLSMEVVG